MGLVYHSLICMIITIVWFGVLVFVRVLGWFVWFCLLVECLFGLFCCVVVCVVLI